MAERRQITVGPANADVVGSDGRAIQIAIDALSFRGGGTVRVLPTEYILADAVRLGPDISLIGERDKTILRRAPTAVSRLAVDADTGQDEMTPGDAKIFEPGVGVCLYDEESGWVFSDRPYVVRHIEDGVLYLHDFLTGERCAANNGIVVNYFPLILAERADNVMVEGFTLDGKVEPVGSAEALKVFEKARPGLRSALAYFYHSRKGVMRNLIARNGLGDGLCFGKARVGTTVEDCEAYDNQWYGIHPGSHSASCAIRRCHIHHNGSDGLYICWGVRHSVFEENEIHHNGWRQLRSGISIGHKDTDNLIFRNHIYENKKFGVCFRAKTEANGAHRNVLRENTIENNGTCADEMPEVKGCLQPREGIGCGVHVSGITKDLVLEKNIIRETRKGERRCQAHAVYLGPGVSRVKMVGNKIDGHPKEAVVDKSGARDNELQYQ